MSQATSADTDGVARLPLPALLTSRASAAGSGSPTWPVNTRADGVTPMTGFGLTVTCQDTAIVAGEPVAPAAATCTVAVRVAAVRAVVFGRSAIVHPASAAAIVASSHSPPAAT